MRACDEIRLDVGGRTIAGKRFRGGRIPTIALHGWLDNANSFDAFAQAMPELDLFAMDFAGHGLSDPRAPDVGYWGWLDAQDVIAVADRLGWRQFVIVAHSMGAEYSTQLVGIYPERVSAQICIDGYVEATTIDKVLDGVRENLDTCLSDADGTLRGYESLDAMAQRLEQAKGNRIRVGARAGGARSPQDRRGLRLVHRTTHPAHAHAAATGRHRGGAGEAHQGSYADDRRARRRGLVQALARAGARASCRDSRKSCSTGRTTCTCRRRCPRSSRRSGAFSLLTATSDLTRRGIQCVLRGLVRRIGTHCVGIGRQCYARDGGSHRLERMPECACGCASLGCR